MSSKRARTNVVVLFVYCEKHPRVNHGGCLACNEVYDLSRRISPRAAIGLPATPTLRVTRLETRKP